MGSQVQRSLCFYTQAYEWAVYLLGRFLLLVSYLTGSSWLHVVKDLSCEVLFWCAPSKSQVAKRWFCSQHNIKMCGLGHTCTPLVSHSHKHPHAYHYDQSRITDSVRHSNPGSMWIPTLPLTCPRSEQFYPFKPWESQLAAVPSLHGHINLQLLQDPSSSFFQHRCPVSGNKNKRCSQGLSVSVLYLTIFCYWHPLSTFRLWHKHFFKTVPLLLILWFRVSSLNVIFNQKCSSELISVNHLQVFGTVKKMPKGSIL